MKDIEVDMVLLEKVHDDLKNNGKAFAVMLANVLRTADKEKNAEAIEQGVSFAADAMAHQIAFQYCVHKAEKQVDAPGKKNPLEGYEIIAQGCEVHQKLREALKGFFHLAVRQAQQREEDRPGPNSRFN